MIGRNIDNISNRKLAILCGIVFLCQVICFMVPWLYAPSLRQTDQLLATKCYDSKGQEHGLSSNQKWFYPSGKWGCRTIEDIADASSDITLNNENVVFAFQMPLPRDGLKLDYSR